MTTAGGAATTRSLAAPRWADLTSDLLRDISSRLHDAADFARFHAVCEPWRNSLPSPTTTTFFPCLVAPHDDFSGLKLIRCPFSNASYRTPTPVRFGKRGWVARADGTAAWFLAALPEPRLVDPLTGSAAPMPFFPDNDGAMENYSRGAIYDDGTTFLYNFVARGRTMVFKAAILFPGDTVWRFFEGTVNSWNRITHYLAAYHDGKILLDMELNTYHTDHCLALLDADTGDTVVERVEQHEAWWMPDGEVITYWRESTHVLESRGELLRVSVLARRDGNLKGQGAAGHARALAVSVHALEGVEEADTADGSVRQVIKWTSRDGRSLADRVLFLGFPTSFSVDAARFHSAEDDVTGGCAYFFHSWSVGHGPAKSPCRLFRYSLVDRKAKFMEHLAPEWSGLKERCVWLVPQPEIAPVEVIRERLEADDVDYRTKRSTIHTEGWPQHSELSFRVLVVVRNLPPSVDSSRVSRFFDKHGKVVAVEVTSPGTARVTMLTKNEPDDAEAALDGLVMDGFTLLVRRSRRKQRGRGNTIG